MTPAPGIPTLPTIRAQAETRFIGLMTELFQLDDAQALDFGLYRVIRRHNREVRAFLGEISNGPDGPTLLGGRLSALLDDAFAAADDEADAAERDRLARLAEQLGLRPGMTPGQRGEALDRAEAVPAMKTGSTNTAGKLAQHPADRVYTNDPTGLSFPGCERLEAIETAFALQFGRT